MNLKYMIANAVVRRVVYIAVAALIAFAGALLSGKAHAQDQPPCTTGSPCSQQTAYSLALAYANSSTPCAGTTYPINQGPNSVIVADANRYRARTTCYRTDWNQTSVTTSSITWFHNFCPAGTTWNEATHTCHDPDECLSRAPLANQSYSGISGACVNSCTFVPSIGDPGDKIRVTGSGASQRTWASNLMPTGAACTLETERQDYKPDLAVCTATGNSFKECVKPDGQHCVTGAKGSVLCWQPGETGTRQTGDGSFAADRVVAPNTPAISTAIENPTPVASTTTTINNATYNTTVATGTGNSGAQPNVGTGGSTGNGTGTSDGTGQGTGGDGDGDGEGDGPGSPGAGVGELYEGNGKTMDSVVSAWWVLMQDTPMLAQINTFFGNCGYSGACPAMTYSNDWMGDLNFSQLCDGTMGDVLTFAGFVVLAMGAFAAFRIAVY